MYCIVQSILLLNSYLQLFAEVGEIIFFFKSANNKVANSWDHFAIVNAHIFRFASLHIANLLIFMVNS
jgi:hypothetical protein